MSWLYRNIVRPALFSMDSEEVHDLTMAGLGRVGATGLGREMIESFYGMPELPIDLWGLRFPNPVGLAAGMDKQAAALPAWAALGFGFSELGGVTSQAQPGHPRPRMFRLVEEQALINRMGFNNPGAEAFAARLEGWKRSGSWPAHPVGVNLGKSKDTPLGEAAQDYAESFRRLHPLADFFVVNVSSPNTPQLRELQAKQALDDILAGLVELNHPHKPVLVKVAPELSDEALDEILEVSANRRMAGIVACNTTTDRTGLHTACGTEAGGLSGRPLRARSTAMIRHIYRQLRGHLPIIGVGGIFTAADAFEKIQAGASLVQVYTGLVYEGPGIAREIVAGLGELLTERGFRTVAEAVGTGLD